MRIIISFKKAIVLILFLSAIAGALIIWQSRFTVSFLVLEKFSGIKNHLPIDSSTELSNPPSPPYQGGNYNTPALILPDKVLLPVPFGSQSPYALWDERDEESCEEASIAMVHYFWQKKKLTRAAMRQELDKLIAFQVKSTYS